MKKQDARTYGLSARSNLSPAEKAQKETKIFEQLKPLLDKASLVGCYRSFGNEVSTEAVIAYCFDHGIRVCVPIVKGNTLVFSQITPDTEYAVSSFGVPEPTGHVSVFINEIDLMIVPLSSFDEQCNRTGYGKGYYDSVLGDCRYSVGVAFAEQKVDFIETEVHDIPLNCIISA